MNILEALRECADDLEAEIKGRYGYKDTDGSHVRVHPAMQRRYDRDMAPVVNARKVLEEYGCGAAEVQRRNPFPVRDAFGRVLGWKWYDETSCECDMLYASQEDALKDLQGYIHFLDHGPTLWQRFWWWFKPNVVRFWHDTRG